MEPEQKKFQGAIALLMLIADSEKARQEGRWVSQEQLEKVLREKFGV